MKKILTLMLVIAFVFSGCIGTKKNTEQAEEANTNDEVNTQDTTSVSSTITFGKTITATDDVEVEDNTATITKVGDYKITGQADDAQLIINAPNEEVDLTLQDLDLTSANTSAITVIDADSLNITLSGENTLSDTASNTDTYQAPLFIDEVETHILGGGILNLNGNYQEGLESNNDLYIEDGILNVTAVDDGINTGDLLDISGGEINIDSEGDGIDSNGDLAISGGTIYVSGGNNGNGPLDYGEGYTFTLTGGTIIAVGGNMGTTPSEDGQTFLTATTTGDIVEVGDYTYEAPKDFSYIFVSYAGLTEDTPVLVNNQEVTTSSEIETTNNGMQGNGMGGWQPF
ncbi:MAG: carbohydrate-binding domain-containing protein [Mycoplasmatales bacterium]